MVTATGFGANGKEDGANRFLLSKTLKRELGGKKSELMVDMGKFILLDLEVEERGPSIPVRHRSQSSDFLSGRPFIAVSSARQGYTDLPR